MMLYKLATKDSGNSAPFSSRALLKLLMLECLSAKSMTNSASTLSVSPRWFSNSVHILETRDKYCSFTRSSMMMMGRVNDEQGQQLLGWVGWGRCLLRSDGGLRRAVLVSLLSLPLLHEIFGYLLTSLQHLPLLHVISPSWLCLSAWLNSPCMSTLLLSLSLPQSSKPYLAKLSYTSHLFIYFIYFYFSKRWKHTNKRANL